MRKTSRKPGRTISVRPLRVATLMFAALMFATLTFATLLGGFPAVAAGSTPVAQASSQPTVAPTPSGLFPEGAPDAAALPVALNSCSTLRVALTAPISSADAVPGDVFHFKTLEPIEINRDAPPVPAEAEGIGVVSLAQHAQRGGQGGFLALDPRYIKLPDGKYANVLVDRSAPSLSPTGKSNNIPGYAGMIPFAGWVLGPYAFLHHGSDITIPKGASFRVFIGDLETVSRCRANAKPQKREAG